MQTQSVPELHVDSNRGPVVRLTRTGILDLLRHIDRLNLKGKTWKLHIFRLNIFTTSTTNRATTWKMLCISFRANNYLLTYDKDILSSENVLQLLWKIFWIRLSKTGLVCWKKIFSWLLRFGTQKKLKQSTYCSKFTFYTSGDTVCDIVVVMMFPSQSQCSCVGWCYMCYIELFSPPT